MTAPAPVAPAEETSRDACSLRDLVSYFVRLGTFGFGGPIALAGYMQRDLVERRRWLTREDYVEGLALAQLAPGPLAAQLAIYIGWVKGRLLGVALVGLAFVLPSFLMVIAISVGYVAAGGMPWMQGAFYGIGAAVIVLGRRAVVDLPTVAIFAATLLVLFKLKKVPEPLVILIAGIVGIALP